MAHAVGSLEAVFARQGNADMLRIITKEDFWAADDAGWLGRQQIQWENFSIKQIQDSVLLHRLQDLEGKRILEVGGGHSRTLPFFSAQNSCVNVDPLEGYGHGPVGDKEEVLPYQQVRAYMGETEDKLPSDSFDIIYSISVIEHVPQNRLHIVLRDIIRVLKPGGRMVHLIDTYLGDRDGDNSEPRARYALYRDVFDKFGCKPTEPDQIIERDKLYFHPSYASNPDLIMNQWNHMAPSMRDTRSVSQACSFILDAVKA